MSTGNTTVPSEREPRNPRMCDPDEEELVPALVIVSSEIEPWRIGEVALLTGSTAPYSIGRGNNLFHAIFGQQRPGSWTPTGPLIGESLSKEACFLAVDSDGVDIEIGKGKSVLVNGVRADVALKPGDLIEVVGYTFMFVMRPKKMAPLKFWKEPLHPFGQADRFGLVGESPAMWALRELLAKLALSGSRVLVLGESGTGKEACCKAIHWLSGRRGPLTIINVATLNTETGVAQLMGHIGAYAYKGVGNIGLIEASHLGTVVLDEIAEARELVHAGLLRAIQHGEIIRLGENIVRTIDVCFVAATNRDVYDEANMKFDLVDRFSDRLRTPTLDVRREDIMLIARAVVLDLAKKQDSAASLSVIRIEGRPPEVRFDATLVEALVQQHYRTNVNEIAVIVSAAILESPDGVLRKPKSKDINWRKRPVATPTAPVKATPEDALATVERHGGEGTYGAKQKAADELGISRDQLKRLLQKSP